MQLFKSAHLLMHWNMVPSLMLWIPLLTMTGGLLPPSHVTRAMSSVMIMLGSVPYQILEDYFGMELHLQHAIVS